MAIAPWSRPLTIGRRLAAALVCGLAVAVIVHVSNLLVLFATNGSSAANIVPISDYFLASSLVLFVLVSIAVFVGACRNRFTALASGLIAGALAAFAGTAYLLISSGKGWDATSAAAAAGSLGGTSLVFVVVSTIAVLVVVRPLWGWFARVSAGVDRPIAMVRRPASTLENGQVTHIDRVAVDTDLADEQWEAYVDTLEANGFEIVEVATADDLPDSVFVEDTIVIFGGTAVVTSPGAESRRAETDAVHPLAARIGLKVREIELPGALDGGDVLKVGATVYVGRGGRTNAEGIRQLRAIVSPLGYTVITVPITKVLHLKSAVTALPDGTVIGFAKFVDTISVFDRFMAVPEATGAAVVVLSSDTVLMASSAPKTAAMIENLGYRVVTVDVSEFEKLEGCVTCLSVRIR